MEIQIAYGTENLDWPTLCELIRLSPLGLRDPEKLKIASENSFVVCAAFVGDKIVGFGRALSDGQYQSAIYDVVVLPDYQMHGVGKLLVESLLKKLPKESTVLIYVAPGKQIFYENLGFGHLKTGMGLFPNPEKSRNNGYLL
jgi:ribosomal protein S18 acetylase RimI-like enzyme